MSHELGLASKLEALDLREGSVGPQHQGNPMDRMVQSGRPWRDP